MGTKSRVLFYVQHLLGVGHVRRASLIAEAMATSGMDVHVVLGGTPVVGMSFSNCTCHRLPEARAVDSSFSGLVNSAGNPVNDGWRNARREILLSLYADLSPDVLLIEQFPFGRRQFRFELLPLLELARSSASNPRIACSVRDILVTKNALEKNHESVSYIEKYFDAVIVHGDPAFVQLESTFPLASAFAEKIRYSGYVAPPDSPDATSAGHGEVIVASGGGAVGAELMICAAHAKADSTLSNLIWRFLRGPNLPQSAIDSIMRLNDPRIVVEFNRPDYGSLLRNCTLSISQGGYNTLMDIVRARCPAVIVPFGRGMEDEQGRRTTMLQEQGYVTMLASTELTADTLITNIEQAMALEIPKQVPFSLEGAAQTAEIIANDQLFTNT